jgi:hypothetical protein
VEEQQKDWEARTHPDVPEKPIGYFFAFDSADKLACWKPFRTEKALEEMAPQLIAEIYALWKNQSEKRLTAGWLWLPEPTYLRPENYERFEHALGVRASSPLLLMQRDSSGDITVTLRDQKEDRFRVSPSGADDGSESAAQFLVEDLLMRFKGLPDSDPFSGHEGKKRYMP